MTLLNLFPLRVQARPEHVSSDDRSILLMVVLLLGLVFVPVIGLHIVVAAFSPEPPPLAPDSLAHHTAPPAKPTRG